MRFKRKHLNLAVGMDVTPLIDIVFLLLIFFMLTSSFVFQPGIKVHLPKAVTADIVRQESWIIQVSGKDHLYFRQQLVTLQELQTKLKDRSSHSPPVLIQADRQARLGRVVEVWDLCRKLGIDQVNIATVQGE